MDCRSMTHYEGCPCHEARHRAELDAERRHADALAGMLDKAADTFCEAARALSILGHFIAAAGMTIAEEATRATLAEHASWRKTHPDTVADPVEGAK